MTTRRTFIKNSGVFVSALVVNPSTLLQKNMPVGIQLYSLRDEVGKGLNDVLAKMAKAGYSDVETYGFTDGKFFGIEPKAFKKLLQQNHLTSTSGHYGMNKFLISNGPDDEVTKLIQAAKALGQNYLTVSSFSHETIKTPDDYKRVADRFNKAGVICKKEGVQLAYHNHDWEFKDLNGTSGYDVLLKDTNPSLLKMELDLFWAVRGGRDPIAMFQKFPGRFPLWHVKDMNKTQETKNTEIGSGSIDFKKIFANAKLAGMKHFYMEQENFDMDPYESISKSAQYIKQTLLK